MEGQRLIFRIHAIQRMFQRRISPDDIRGVLLTGEVIERYLEDQPYPSRPLLGWHGSQPLHVVVADNSSDLETIVITAYEPDRDQRDSDFRSRRTP